MSKFNFNSTIQLFVFTEKKDYCCMDILKLSIPDSTATDDIVYIS